MIWAILTPIIGAIVTVFVWALMTIAKEADERIELMFARAREEEGDGFPTS